MGESLVDLLETRLDGRTAYLPAVGGAPLNVAVGITRLGGAAELVGSVGADAFGDRIRAFLAVAMPTRAQVDAREPGPTASAL